MKILYLFYSVFFLLILSVSSCKKEDPQPEPAASAAQPVFTFNGTIDGAPIAIAAGGNEYYMSTTCAPDASGVLDFVGELKPKTCTGTCGNSLKISIKDGHPFSILSSDIDSAIVEGYYAYATPSGTSSQYSSLFISGIANATIKSFTWDFGDGTTAVTISSSIIHKYLHPGIYKVSLVAESTNGCISTISNNIQLGQTGNNFLPDFNASATVGDSISFIPIPIGGIPPFTYVWDFGDGTQSTDFNPIHKYPSGGVYKASLTMTDLTGTSNVQYKNVSTLTNTACSATFLVPSSTAISNPLNLGNVEVEWTDNNGKVWTSKNSNQSSSKSLFKVLSVENYLTSPSGNPTKKLHVNFTCTLYNGLKYISMNNIDGVFAVEYK